MPIDKSIVDTYIAMLTADKSVEEAEEARVEAEAGRVEAETARASAEASRVIAEGAREATSSADHAVAVSDHTTAVADHTTAEGDHSTATSDHTASVEATEAAGVATNRANEAAAAAEHMVDIKTGPQGPQGNTGSSVDYPYELVNNVTTDDATKGLSAAQGVVLDGKISQLGQYLENPEWVRVVTDDDGKILYGVKTDGKFYFGDDCPPQVQEYVGQQINSIGIDALLATKVDKENGKSLVDAEFASSNSVIDSPEFLEVITDEDDKVLEGLKKDGTKVFSGNVEVGGNTKVIGTMEVSGVLYKVIENPEFLAAWVDAEDKVVFGFKSDGKTYVGDADFLNDIKDIKAFLPLDKIIDWDALSSFAAVENPEYIEVKTDSEGKVVSGRKSDGAAFENVGFSAPIVDIDGHSLKNIKDIEGRTEILTDNEGKIISYRDSAGVRHEEVGIETNRLLLTKEGMEDFQQQLNESGFLPNKSVSTKEYDLPKFGYVNLVSETFYLTATGWSSYDTDVELIQDYEDTNENAWNKVTIAHFYIKGTQTKLDFYAASKVTKVDSRYYVTSTLTENIDPVTGDTSYEVNENSVEVRQCVDVPPYKAWSVDKNTEHYCTVEIDFGHYLNGTFPVGIKYQGSSTLQWRKRNFRFTFYKNNKYEKKNKIKIGEFVRLNGFNLKANWTDNTKIKELFMNILFMAIWENRGKCTSYPWDGDDAPYNGATGMIKGFPIEVNVGGIFYGLDVFGLKKDGKNYLLDKDEDGMIEGGTRNDVGCWETAAPIDWEDELNDEEDWVIDNQTQSNYDAIIDFFAFINGTLEEDGTTVPFDKSTMPDRMFMPAWIDYLICLQVFLMLDSTCRNVMLYTGPDKKKFYPFFYDLDASMKYDNPTMDIMIPNGSPEWQEGGCYAYDLSLWEHIKEEWWDEIVNRYHELRRGILSDEYIKAVYEDILDNIPDEEYRKESQRWGLQVSKQNFYETINQLKVRFNWLDNEYYK